MPPTLLSLLPPELLSLITTHLPSLSFAHLRRTHPRLPTSPTLSRNHHLPPAHGRLPPPTPPGNIPPGTDTRPVTMERCAKHLLRARLAICHGCVRAVSRKDGFGELRDELGRRARCVECRQWSDVNEVAAVEGGGRIVKTKTSRVGEWVRQMRGARRDETGRKVAYVRCVEGSRVRIEVPHGRREKERGPGGVSLDGFEAVSEVQGPSVVAQVG